MPKGVGSWVFSREAGTTTGASASVVSPVGSQWSEPASRLDSLAARFAPDEQYLVEATNNLGAYTVGLTTDEGFGGRFRGGNRRRGIARRDPVCSLSYRRSKAKGSRKLAENWQLLGATTGH